MSTRRFTARASLCRGMVSASGSTRLNTTISQPDSLSTTRLRILALYCKMVEASANITSWATAQLSGKRAYSSPTSFMPLSSATTRWARYFFCSAASCCMVTVS